MFLICHFDEEKYFASLNGNKSGGGVYQGYSGWQVMSQIEGCVRLS